jgi:hypothetical protein
MCARASTYLYDLIVFSSGTYFIRVGSNIFDAGALYNLILRVWHGNYNPKTVENDIAMVKTAIPIVLGPTVQLISLPTSPLPDGATVLVSGWGKTSVSIRLYCFRILLILIFL